MTMTPWTGIFVGGRGARMGGAAKGMLELHGEPLVVRARRIAEAVGTRCVLVGRHAAYAGLDLPVIDDEPGVEGPLAGLLALLAYTASAPLLAVACDMPYLDEAILRALLDAPPAPIVAVRSAERWEPFVARYHPPDVLPVARRLARAGERRLQRVLDEAGAVPLHGVDPDAIARALVDWDTPDDVDASLARSRPA